MVKDRPYTSLIECLREAGLRPTRQRLALARLLFDEGDRHVTAEQLYAEARREEIPVSLATIYNTLNQFRKMGLLREVVVDSGRSWFDTNLDDHHHFFHEVSGTLTDFRTEDLAVKGLPTIPAGMEDDRVDVIVRIRDSRQTPST
ncbi:MAG: Fur family transcriptional regulator, partial [Rhodospirillaceae bacterium]|nr:Fur family transcriptional regulator [Rhodospirillaceae bacterium]